MKNFEYYSPTKIIYGPGEFKRLGKEAAAFGKRVLLVKAAGPLEKLGVYKQATDSLKEAGLTVFTLENVAANPKLASVREGIETCKRNDVQVVVAVGGGSAIDCAKAVAVGAVDSGDVWDFFTTKRSPSRSLPIGAVSTIAATGAEMSPHCVITNEETRHKYASHYSFNYPKFAIIDAELHKSVPRFLTACGLCDTITHVAENYFVGDRNTPLTDRIAEGVVLTVLESEGVLDSLGDIEMRNNLAWAAAIGICGLTDCGRGIFYYGAHVMEHAISAHFDVTHGAGLSVVHPAWLAFINEQDSWRFARFGERVFGLKRDGRSEKEMGRATVEAFKAKYKSWGLPVTLKEIGVGEKDFEKIAEEVTTDPDSGVRDKKIVFDVLGRCK